MISFQNYQDLSAYTIEECMTIARCSIDTPKGLISDSCYGMPALILLSSVIDIIGTFYRSANYQYSPITENDVKKDLLGGAKQHFKNYYNKFLCSDPQCQFSEDDFVDYFYHYARCKSIHNGSLHPDIRINKGHSATNAFLTINTTNQQADIYLEDLYTFISRGYTQLKIDLAPAPPSEITGPCTGNTQTKT